MNRKQRIEALLKANVGWAASDEQFLTELDDAAFDRIAGTVKALTDLTAEVATLKANAVKPATNAAEYIAAAPAEFRPTLQAMASLQEQYRASLIGAIKGNAANPLSDQQLQALSDDVLEAMAVLARAPKANVADFSGRAGASAPTSGLKDNEGKPITGAPAVPDFPKR